MKGMVAVSASAADVWDGATGAPVTELEYKRRGFAVRAVLDEAGYGDIPAKMGGTTGIIRSRPCMSA